MSDPDQPATWGTPPADPNRSPPRGGIGRATRAYAASSAHRGVRQQEADVFRRANATLRRGQNSGTMSRTRALADNSLLWITVMDLMRDPQNRLPDQLRGLIVSVGLAVQREMQNAAPDFDFLMTVNEDIASGLAQASP
jgi:flagellar biosynthesis regulator FlaF